MATRLKMRSSNSEGYKAILNLDAYVGDALGSQLRDLIFLRASQINGCNYCVDSHSTDLIDGGMPVRKVIGVVTWRESAFFDDRERLALELTEALTNIAGGVDDDLWRRGVAGFGEKGLGDIIIAVGMIGVWNRIGIATHLETPALKA
jgi:AhpD family alkylhydroperoxidase